MKKRLKVFSALLALVILFYVNLIWLWIGFILTITIVLIINRLIVSIRNVFVRKTLFILTSFFAFLLLGICMKVFLFELFRIPSSSMENTLYKGDVILVDKLYLGPKLPRTLQDIPWFNVLFDKFPDTQLDFYSSDWTNSRLDGFSHLSKGDIVVYNYLSDNQFLVKRCVATAGDRIQMSNGAIIVNDTIYNEPMTVKKDYTKVEPHCNISRLSINNPKDIIRLDTNEILITPYSPENRSKATKMPQQNMLKFENSGMILIVPYKGMSLRLTKSNYNFYKKTIDNFENKIVTKKGSRYYIDEKEIREYVFENDYFFALGDNRGNSIDSRVVGFLPYNSLVGKAQYVLYSNKKSSGLLDRIMIKID